MVVIIERSMHPGWLSNTWLVADRPGGHAVLIDTGGPPGPILMKIEALRLTVTHALCTHHHLDHVENNGLFKERTGCIVCGHGSERRLFGALDREVADGEEIAPGGLRIRALHIPGHTIGQLAYVVGDEAVFTGDTLFRGSVGGTRAPGHATIADLRRSVMDVLMALPRGMAVHPGHTESTTIGAEWEANPFIRAWRGEDAVRPRPCTVRGEAASLLLRAADYDGGTKCWVRFEADGREDIVPGSIVRDL
jgi:glyoxylase-like metal-dependent hydrolase (beta-lactamase superfamily II)